MWGFVIFSKDYGFYFEGNLEFGIEDEGDEEVIIGEMSLEIIVINYNYWGWFNGVDEFESYGKGGIWARVRN